MLQSWGDVPQTCGSICGRMLCNADATCVHSAVKSARRCTMRVTCFFLICCSSVLVPTPNHSLCACCCGSVFVALMGLLFQLSHLEVVDTQTFPQDALAQELFPMALLPKKLMDTNQRLAVVGDKDTVVGLRVVCWRCVDVLRCRHAMNAFRRWSSHHDALQVEPFLAAMDAVYPGFDAETVLGASYKHLTVPPLSDVVMPFTSESDLTSYVTSDSYEDSTKVRLAVHVHISCAT